MTSTLHSFGHRPQSIRTSVVSYSRHCTVHSMIHGNPRIFPTLRRKPRPPEKLQPYQQLTTLDRQGHQTLCPSTSMSSPTTCSFSQPSSTKTWQRPYTPAATARQKLPLLTNGYAFDSVTDHLTGIQLWSVIPDHFRSRAHVITYKISKNRSQN